MPPIFSSTLRAWVIARSTIVLHAAESLPPAQDAETRKSGLGLTLRAGFFGGRTPAAGRATLAFAATAAGPRSTAALRAIAPSLVASCSFDIEGYLRISRAGAA